MYFLLNLSHYGKVMIIYVKFLAFFMMPALQIWPCHVTQEANLEKNYFFLILHLILGKVTKFLVEKLSISEWKILNYFFLILHLILGKVTKFLVEKLSSFRVENTPPPPPPPVLLGLKIITNDIFLIETAFLVLGIFKF